MSLTWECGGRKTPWKKEYVLQLSAINRFLIHENVVNFFFSIICIHVCPLRTCLVRLTWISFVMGGRWPYSWWSKDELISDVLLWTPTYGRAKSGRPARTYMQQLCEDTGCSPEDLPEVMNDREKWRERVRDIRAGGTTWWWWWCP